jgi:hypothetical protein
MSLTPVPVTSPATNRSAPPRATVQALHPGAAQRVAVHLEADSAAARLQLEAVAGVGAVHELLVAPVAAVECVRAVTRLPDEAVVAGAEEHDIVAGPAVDDIVPITGEDHHAMEPPAFMRCSAVPSRPTSTSSCWPTRRSEIASAAGVPWTISVWWRTSTSTPGV